MTTHEAESCWMDPPGAGLPQQILVSEPGNSREIELIIADDGVSEGKGLGGDQKIVAPNRSGQPFRAVREECRS
jgi:hypothetical protein